MSKGKLLTEGTVTGVRLERVLPDPPSVVWRAITDREELRSWFPSDVIVEGGEWKAGAAISFVFPSDVIDMTLEGEVLDVDEPRSLAYTWGDETLRYELSAEGSGTRLVLINELPAGRAARNATGWEMCLERLAGEPGDDSWQTRFDGYRADFEPVVGAQEGPPAGYKDSTGA